MNVTLKAVNDWNARVDVALHNALQASVEMLGSTGRQACERAVVLMAKIAAANTKQSPKNRKVLRNDTRPRYRYVETYNATGQVKRFPEWAAEKLGITWEQAKRIGSRGLARRSWMWGIARLVKASKPIPGVGSLREILGRDGCGLVLTNRLSYIRKAAPSNVEAIAARGASNQIMARVAKRIERKFAVEVPRLAEGRAKRAARSLARDFARGAGKGAA